MAWRVLLKDVVAQEGSAGWVGQIYAEKPGEYKDATITLAEPEHMQIVVKVGFMRSIGVIKGVLRKGLLAPPRCIA
jgi:hypothetical protein